MEYQNNNISPNNFEQCIKCTICTVYCPVAAVNSDYPGPKQAGPDGERYRLKNPQFYNAALKYCLNCKRCEVSCPSNVRIGDIIQQARLTYDTSAVKLRDRMLAETDFVGSLSTLVAPIVNTTLKLKPVKKALEVTFNIDSRRTFPQYSSGRFDSWMAKQANDQAAYAKQVAFFHGCYINYNYPQLGKDVVKVLNAMGIGVQPLEKEKCCGVAKIANRLTDRARHDGEINIASIRKAVEAGLDVIGAGSTCIFTMRDEYPHLLGIDNKDVRNHILTATAYIYRLIEQGKVKLAFKRDFKLKAAYHTPCHLQKLGWAVYTTSLLRMIPGLDLNVLEQNCCGIAGTYGFKGENYDYSQAIGSELFDQIRQADCSTVITDCETCKWQIEHSTGLKVMHPISVLAEAIDVEATKRLNNV